MLNIKPYLLFLLILVSTAHAQNVENERRPGFIKGYTWGWTGTRGEYLGEKPEKSLQLLAATGTQWIALAFAGHMETKRSPHILYGSDNEMMVSDEEIRRAIRLAREHQFKIILKPVVNCNDGAWRAMIDFDDEKDWDKWWQSYEGFLLHYARIASETKCEMFCVGCEMRSTEQFVKRWRSLISEVRKTYNGLIVYNINHDDIDRVEWFDVLDIIGVSAYWPVASKEDTSLDNMLASWKPIRQRLRELSAKSRKPILFMEIGMRSAATCSSMPWDWEHQELPYDGDEQARYYEAALQSFWNNEPWFIGYCWWDWKAQLYDREEGKNNKDFCIYGKPAEEVLLKWYSKARNAP
jgi:hypothetical protein